ncbi:crossover junction endodeoxyribonuclease RuvC [Patescibacteria group bacterium]|nr:crossover junction endodeoxyribonuclease RuvC [Patescibacteria group bacterium]MBU1931778.1 crossover junction endodeoxyribonuclease RuvC [Patescibacteria group bacterium]
MIVLGIDPGIALTGWGIVKKQAEPQLIKYGCIRTKKDQPLNQRLLTLYKELKQIIKQYQPQIACVEKLFFNTNAKTALTVGEARGVIKVCLAFQQLPMVEFTPIQIKNSIVGYGRADKNQVQNMVKALLKLDHIPQPDDAADAIATALTYCFYNPELA